MHLKSDFSRARFCKTLSERHLRALDKIFFSLVQKKIWYYGITSSFSLSSKYLCDCAAPLGTEYCWNIQSLERCDTQFVLKLSTWFHPNLILEKWSKYILKWYMIKSNQKKNQKIPKMQMAEKSPNRKIVKSGKNLKIRKCASDRKIWK